MKTLKYFLYLFLVSLLVVSCDERDFDAPPLQIPEFNGKANTTIQELKDLYDLKGGGVPMQITDTLMFKARVIGNDKSGNIFKQLVVQDSLGSGIIISIDATQTHTQFPVGEEVFVNMYGLWIGKYGGEHQIGVLYNNTQIGRMDKYLFEDHVKPNGLPVEMTPKVVTIDELSVNSASYVNTLVRIDNVSFVNGGVEGHTLAAYGDDAANATEEKVVDDAGRSMTVRTSKYSNFAYLPLPTSRGSIIGVLGRYNGSWQFTLRDKVDLLFGDVEKGTGSGNPFSVNEAIAKGTDANKWWVKGYIVGSVGLNINDGNHITGKSEDFILSGEFTPATIVIADNAAETDWTKFVVVTLPAGSDMRAALNLQAHPGNKGKEVTVQGALGSYLGSKGGVTPATGSKSEYVFQSTTDGDGTKENPYSFNQAVLKQGETGKWVKAYIVGSVKDKSLQADAQFVGPFTNASNMLIAATPNETNPSNCIPVQLVYGTTARTALNLVENPGNLGKEVLVYGDLIAYFGAPGIKNTSDYVIDGGGVTPPPVVEGKGTGTKEDPYDYANAVTKQGETGKWIEVYIVGSIDTKDIKTESRFEAPFIGSANVLVAASPNEKDYTKCMPVQLVYNTTPRADLNLVDHVDNLGKKVKILGDLTAYFGVPGMKNPTEYVLE